VHREDLVGATAVQVAWSWRKGSRLIEHLGSAHDDVGLAALKAAATERLAAGQTELDLGISGGVEPGTLPILSSQMTHLWEALCAADRGTGRSTSAAASPLPSVHGHRGGTGWCTFWHRGPERRQLRNVTGRVDSALAYAGDEQRNEADSNGELAPEVGHVVDERTQDWCVGH
jgi:hypothetical protein